MIIGDKKIYNKSISLYDKLSNEFNKDWNNITLCSAFLSNSAAESLIELIDNITNKKVKLTIIIGIKNNFTQPSAIRILLDYINTCRKTNIEFKLILPMDNDFHIKAYIFKNNSISKAIVGSANLTDTGLKSKGELCVEIINDDVNTISECIDRYLDTGLLWNECIDKYEKKYNENKLNIVKADVQSLKTSKIIKRAIKKKKTRLYKPMNTYTNLKYQNKVSPTMGILDKVTKEGQRKIDIAFKAARQKNLSINKTNAILFFNQSPEYIDYICDKYKVNSIFDRPDEINQSWNIGDKRCICTIGEVSRISEEEVIIFMKRGCIHYKVTPEIMDVAEELNIKPDIEDEEIIPLNENMKKYIRFVKNNR